jgi:hypothetical protein
MSHLSVTYRYEGSADAIVRARLRTWPQHPPGVLPSPKQPGTWLRARPGEANGSAQPFLKLPGSSTFRTLPDGMWLHFGTDPSDPWCDILCIEACSSLPNLLDKRSRFAPSTTSTLACCPLSWLMEQVQPNDPTPRWKLIRVLSAEPTGALILPVRDVRVVYGLRARHYVGFARTQIPQPHEYYCPMEVLTAVDGSRNPAMQALLGRASAAANFMELP